MINSGRKTFDKRESAGLVHDLLHGITILTAAGSRPLRRWNRRLFWWRSNRRLRCLCLHRPSWHLLDLWLQGCLGLVLSHRHLLGSGWFCILDFVCFCPLGILGSPISHLRNRKIVDSKVTLGWDSTTIKLTVTLW